MYSECFANSVPLSCACIILLKFSASQAPHIPEMTLVLLPCKSWIDVTQHRLLQIGLRTCSAHESLRYSKWYQMPDCQEALVNCRATVQTMHGIVYECRSTWNGRWRQLWTSTSSHVCIRPTCLSIWLLRGKWSSLEEKGRQGKWVSWFGFKTEDML